MAWLARKRDAMTADLGARTLLRPIMDFVAFDILPNGTLPQSLSFDVTDPQRLDSGLVFNRLSLHVGNQPLGISAACLNSSPWLTTFKKTVFLLKEADATPHTAKLGLKANAQTIGTDRLRVAAKAHSVLFEEPRPEPGEFLFPPSETRSTRKQKHERAKAPQPPPTSKKLDLEERLRVLLMPPIDEILAESQLFLPEEPFKYQKEGIWWLLQRQNALLADEMGLGKTMQAIIAARLLWREKKISRILVVCPKTLIPNWRREFTMWWPQVAGHIHISEGELSWFLKLATSGVVVKIVNYEKLAREVDSLDSLKFSHDLVIIDEAQRIKNAKSATARAVKMLPSEYRWALTGTPLENRVEDVVSIFEFVRPGLLKGNDADHVRQRIAPYMLRRIAEEVLPDLPPKRDEDFEVELGIEQRMAYQAAEEKGVVELNARGDSITITHVFQLITSLRKICNFDPASGESAKLEIVLEEIEEISSSHKKALVFSQFTNEFGIERLIKGLAEYDPIAIHGKVAPARRDARVQFFNSDPKSKIMLLNYMVGGVGLNLHSANYVYLFDRWWNPAVEDQAVKRAHRLGQKDRVFVKRFVCKDTIEERILQILRKKRTLFDAVIDEARPDKAMGLSEEEIFSLFDRLKVRPKRKAAPPGPPTIDLSKLPPDQFEVLVSKVYQAMGYRVAVTGRSHDGGIDIRAERAIGSGRDVVVVQCKHQAAPVSREVIQQLWGVVNSVPRITRGDLVTSARFSGPASEFAADKRLTLIDGNELRELIRKYNVAKLVD